MPLAFDVASLNRVTDTLQLHRRFSEDHDENPELVQQRISRVWKNGIKVGLAPFTSHSLPHC